MMEHVPPEIVAKIFTFLDPSSTITCRQTCRRWNVISIRMVNPLYLPAVMSKVLQCIQVAPGRLRHTLHCRQVCKRWKEGFDILTQKKLLLLKGVTAAEPREILEVVTHEWNPFPSGIVRVKLCYGHDDPATPNQENEHTDLMLSRFGSHVKFLQVSLEHADCAEQHLAKAINILASNLEGLVISETPSPFRFSKPEPVANSAGLLATAEVNMEIRTLEKLHFLKLDDSDYKLKYTTLYSQVIQNSPKLTHLEINGYHHLDMQVLRLLESPELHLTHLKLDAEDPHHLEVLEILNRSSFALTYLSLKVKGFGDATECAKSANLLHNFLKNRGSTLERLELKLEWVKMDNNTNFELLANFPNGAILKKLRRFKLVGYLGQLDFLLEIPSLEALMIVDFIPETQQKLVSKEVFQKYLPKVRELHLLVQQTLYDADNSYKNKLQNFMYEEDASFVQKYCGLYQEIFP